MNDWPDHPYNYTKAAYLDWVNQFPPEPADDAASDKRRGRAVANMTWALAPDEALIIEFNAHDGLWSITNMGVFFNSMDYLYRPVSYTPSRTKVGQRRQGPADSVSRRSGLSQLAGLPGVRARQRHLSKPDERGADNPSYPAGEALPARGRIARGYRESHAARADPSDARTLRRHPPALQPVSKPMYTLSRLRPRGLQLAPRAVQR